MKKTVLITGATGYFGKYMVEALASEYHVLASSRSEDKLRQMFSGSDITPVPIDIYDQEGMASALEDVCKRFEIHGLINNAYDFSPRTGFNTPEGKLEEISLEQMRAGLESGLLAPMVFAQVVGRSMIAKKIRGSIINVASMYGTVAPDLRLYQGKKVFNPVTYSVAKSGVGGLTRYIASFWGTHGIRCNSISPGPFPNVETDSVNAPDDKEFMDRLKNKTVLGRVGHPRDLIAAVKLLLSEESSYITGQNIGVDGGWTAI